MSPFDPLKFASDIANGIGSGIGQVASDAFRIAEQAGAAVADGIGQAFEAVTKTTADAANCKPEPRYSATITKKCVYIKPCKITVLKITEDNNGNPIESRPRTMRMSRDGIEIVDSLGQTIESLSIANCSLFSKSEKVDTGNPLMKIAAGAFGWSHTPYGPLPGALLGAASSIFAQKERDIWHAEIMQHNGEKIVYRLADKSDGEELIDFLETYMREM